MQNHFPIVHRDSLGSWEGDNVPFGSSAPTFSFMDILLVSFSSFPHLYITRLWHSGLPSLAFVSPCTLPWPDHVRFSGPLSWLIAEASEIIPGLQCPSLSSPLNTTLNNHQSCSVAADWKCCVMEWEGCDLELGLHLASSSVTFQLVFWAKLFNFS